MIETMYDCYLSQFACMKNIMCQQENSLKEFVKFYASAAPDRLYLIGSGTSINACTAAAPFMSDWLGIEVTTVTPSAMGRFYGQRPLAIAVSQSGRSTNTISAIKQLKALGIPVATLTDPIETPVGRSGDLAVPLLAQNELIGPRTRGYTATVLTLYLMALNVGRDSGTVTQAAYDDAIDGFNKTLAQGDAFYETCQAFYDLNYDNLSKARKYIFTGKGLSAKLADECALKVLETLCYPAIGYEYEEFLHGPICFADTELAVFIVLSGDEDKARMLQASDLLGRITPNSYLISHDPAVAGDKVLSFPKELPEAATAFTDILFGQLISAKLTVDLGRTRHPVIKDIFASTGTKAASES